MYVKHETEMHLNVCRVDYFVQLDGSPNGVTTVYKNHLLKVYVDDEFGR